METRECSRVIVIINYDYTGRIVRVLVARKPWPVDTDIAQMFGGAGGMYTPFTVAISPGTLVLGLSVPSRSIIAFLPLISLIFTRERLIAT